MKEENSVLIRGSKKDSRAGLKTAILAVMTATTAVFALFIRIPTSRGYLNLCDVAVYFSAFVFGPEVAMISSGAGAALADLISGFPQWALISLVVHGLEGLLVSLLLGKAKGAFMKVLASLVGIVVVAGGYFILGGFFLVGFPMALLEVLPNVGQSAVGAVLGFGVYSAVKKAYPPLMEFRK